MSSMTLGDWAFTLMMLGSFAYHMLMANRYRKGTAEVRQLHYEAQAALDRFHHLIFMTHGVMPDGKMRTKPCKCEDCNAHRVRIGLKEMT